MWHFAWTLVIEGPTVLVSGFAPRPPSRHRRSPGFYPVLQQSRHLLASDATYDT